MEKRSAGRNTSAEILFQPIVNIHTGTCLGVELIASEFDGEPAKLFEHAVEAFCQIRIAQISLFFRVAAPELTAEFSLAALKALEKFDLKPEFVSLEISEARTSLAHPQPALALKAAGFEVGFDDFGSGCSRLASIYEIQPAFIKLNHALIGDIEADARRRHFVSHLINVSHLFGARVIAKGIHSEADFYRCKALGCDMAQGDLIERASSGKAIPRQGYETVLMLGMRDRRGRDETRRTLAESADPIAPLPDSMDMASVFDTVRKNKQHTCFPVVNSQGKPLGLIKEAKLKDYAYSEFGRSVLLKRTLKDVLQKFLTPCPVADVNTDVETILEMHAADSANEGLILVDDSAYAGFLSAGALVRIMHERSLSVARDCNPLTKLPGNYLIYEYLSSVVRDVESEYVLVYLDIDHFKPFNDKNGFRSGDRVLVLLAEMLRKEFQKTQSFVGHIGGDDFFVGFKNQSMERAREDIMRLTQKFSRDVLPFYDLADQQSGFILCADRDGRPSRFPLATVSAAMLKLEKSCERPEIDEIGTIIASLKKSSKASPQKVAAGISGRHRALSLLPISVSEGH